MNRNLILLMALALAGFASCTKSAQPAVTKFITSDTMFALENQDNVSLEVDMYLSYNDYLNGTNMAYSCVVPAKGTYKIPFSKLDTTATYYYDYYTTDLYSSDWANPNGTSGYPLFYDGHRFEIDTFNLNHGRYYYLHGNSPSTTWKAVDLRYYNNVSNWSSLDANQQYMVLVINRNTSGTITIKQDPGGNLVTTNITNMYAVRNGNNFQTELNLSLSNGQDEFAYNSAIVPDYNYNNATSRDTLVLADGNDNYWIMARQ